MKEGSSTERTIRLKEPSTQDIVFSVMNGVVKTPKSVSFPSSVEPCVITQRYIDHCTVLKYSHGVRYDLVEEIETEYALEFINEQRENRVA